MDKNKIKLNNNYGRVMPRVYNRSRSSLLSTSNVTRHDIPPSVRDGAKPQVFNSASTVYNELPTVLNDYVPNDNPEKTVKPSFVVKPRRTIKSLDPAKPPQVKERASDLSVKSRNIRVQSSAPSVVNRRYRDTEGWSDIHVRGCHSSRSHTKLRELKDEIKAYCKTEKLLKLRSKLYKSCGVVLDNVGQVASDKAVQAELEKIDKDVINIRYVIRFFEPTSSRRNKDYEDPGSSSFRYLGF